MEQASGISEVISSHCEIRDFKDYPKGALVGPTPQISTLDRLLEVDTAKCEYDTSVIEIEGVVSPGGQGGWPHSNNYEVHRFSFSAWREPGKPIVTDELTILRPVDTASTDYFSDYAKLGIYRIIVLLSTDRTRAIFFKHSTHKADSKLLIDIAHELAKPVKIETSHFGELTLNRSIDWFEGSFLWNGQQINIHFHTNAGHDISAGLNVAEQLYADQAKWKKRVDSYAVTKLLSLKNENWLDEGELPISSNQFKSRMTLESISIDSDGNFEFWHGDGDLFCGHSIQICGSIVEGLTQATIAG